MGIEENGPQMLFEVAMSLRSNTPVVGCEINPFVRVSGNGSGQPPPHTLGFTWYRNSASVEHGDIIVPQCMCSLGSDASVEEPYSGSKGCYGSSADAMKNNLSCPCNVHPSQTSNDDELAVAPFENGLSLDSSYHNPVKVEQGVEWIKLGSSRTYVPSLDDLGFTLKLECVLTDNSTGFHLSPVNVMLTDPVIKSPHHCHRRMISLGSSMMSKKFHIESHAIKGGNFTVLSYNILADIYASTAAHRNTPDWALTWEYRRQNLLNEITGYNADILCLQEVQNDHFDTFFEPEMAKFGYSAVYKKKTKEVYSGSQYVTDGCAIFYRDNKFKQIVKYELEFDQTPLSVIEILEPYQRNDCFRLMKGNVAIVLILEAVENDSVHDDMKFRICVANTHIHADPTFEDVKLFQVVNLIKGLEKISNPEAPLLICGDMNSLPRSDPHKYILEGKVRNLHNRVRDPWGIYKHLELSHSMCLASAYSESLLSKGVAIQQKNKMHSETKEPQFTYFGSRYGRTLDYIFYTENSLKVDGFLELLDEMEVGGRALPSPLWSSDHIALMASFSYEQGSHCQQYSPPPPNPWQGKTPGLKILYMEEDCD